MGCAGGRENAILMHDHFTPLPVASSSSQQPIRSAIRARVSISTCTVHVHVTRLQGKRPDKKLARREVPPLLLKIDGIVGLKTAFAFLKMAPNS